MTQSFLLIGLDAKGKDTYIQHVAKEKNISGFDIHTVQPEENSFGIAQVRVLQHTAYLSPAKGSEKILILQHAELLTPQAQNALLKILEEPPVGTYFFLLAPDGNTFLPTVLSRCTTIRFDKKENKKSEENQRQTGEDVAVMQTGSLIEKMALAEKVAAKKEGVGEWIKNCMMLLHEQLLENPEKNVMNTTLLALLQKAYQLNQTTNVSPRLILEHALLS